MTTPTPEQVAAYLAKHHARLAAEEEDRIAQADLVTATNHAAQTAAAKAQALTEEEAVSGPIRAGLVPGQLRVLVPADVPICVLHPDGTLEPGTLPSIHSPEPGV